MNVHAELGRGKAEEMKSKYDRPPHEHCYNPNTDCDQSGEAGWMKTWMEMAQTTKRTGGKVIMVCNGAKRARFGEGRRDAWFDGEAQPGELLFVLNTLGTPIVDIEWAEYDPAQPLVGQSVSVSVVTHGWWRVFSWAFGIVGSARADRRHSVGDSTELGAANLLELQSGRTIVASEKA